MSERKCVGNNPWISLYTIDDYAYASRRKIGEQFMDGNTKADAVEIVASDEKGRLVIIKNNNRPPVGQPVYEFPAGCLEKDEGTIMGAEREFHEETGMTLLANSVILRSFKSAGFGDETTAIVTGRAVGVPSKNFQEDNEDIDVLLLDREQLFNLHNESNNHKDGPLITTTVAMYLLTVIGRFNNA